MTIIGVDFHPGFQQIASVETDGESHEKLLAHPKEADEFYRALAVAGQKVRVGMEASGHARWFERLQQRSSVRTQDRPDQAMACIRTPRN